MAKRTKPKAAQRQQATQHYCRECAHHYDEHSPAIDVHLILCRCPYKMDGGKYSIFLNDRACEKFKPIV